GFIVIKTPIQSEVIKPVAIIKIITEVDIDLFILVVQIKSPARLRIHSLRIRCIYTAVDTQTRIFFSDDIDDTGSTGGIIFGTGIGDQFDSVNGSGRKAF